MAFVEVSYVGITTGQLEHPLLLLYKEKATLHGLALGPCLVKLREATSKGSSVSLVFCRQVYKAKDNETEEIVALKKVRMDNEKEGVGVPSLLLAIAVPSPADVEHHLVTNVRILSSPFAITLVEHDGGAWSFLLLNCQPSCDAISIPAVSHHGHPGDQDLEEAKP